MSPWLSVELHLNRRHPLEGVHDLNAVIVVLKSWKTALFSWTIFNLNFVIRNPNRDQRFHERNRSMHMMAPRASSRPADQLVYDLSAILSTN